MTILLLLLLLSWGGLIVGGRVRSKDEHVLDRRQLRLTRPSRLRKLPIERLISTVCNGLHPDHPIISLAIFLIQGSPARNCGHRVVARPVLIGTYVGNQLNIYLLLVHYLCRVSSGSFPD